MNNIHGGTCGVKSRGVQPFAIAGRITFIYMKYGRQ